MTHATERPMSTMLLLQACATSIGLPSSRVTLIRANILPGVCPHRERKNTGKPMQIAVVRIVEIARAIREEYPSVRWRAYTGARTTQSANKERVRRQNPA